MAIKYLDKNLSLEERRKDYQEIIDKKMNPFSENDFDPETFEPMGEDIKEVTNRQRIVPSKKLNTHGLKPKEIRDGQMIGLYESKQDIYLTFAHRCNEMQNEIDLLKEEIKLLNN